MRATKGKNYTNSRQLCCTAYHISRYYKGTTNATNSQSACHESRRVITQHYVGTSHELSQTTEPNKECIVPLCTRSNTRQTEKCVCGRVCVGRNVHCEIMDLFGNRSLELRCVCLHLQSAPAVNRTECD
jgi:hypothetical protein